MRLLGRLPPTRTPTLISTLTSTSTRTPPQVRLDACGCSGGCLSCVHIAGCSEYNEGLDKAAASMILR